MSSSSLSSGSSTSSSFVAVRRWVAIPWEPTSQSKHVQPIIRKKKPVSARAARVPAIGRRYLPDFPPTSRRQAVKTVPKTKHLKLLTITPINSITNRFGESPGMEYRCPTVFRSPRKIFNTPRLHSQIAVRKTMQVQVDQEKSSSLTERSDFVSCTQLHGTRLAPPSRGKRYNVHYDPSSTYDPDNNLELLAILSVQDHNIPAFSDDVQ